MLFSCLCSILSSSLVVSGGLECCSMGHQERGRPYSLRLLPQNVLFIFSGMEVLAVTVSLTSSHSPSHLVTLSLSPLILSQCQRS